MQFAITMKLVKSRFLPEAVEQTPPPKPLPGKPVYASGESESETAGGGRLNHGSMKLKRYQNYNFSGNDTYEN